MLLLNGIAFGAEDVKVHIIDTTSYHVTIFMPSKPNEVRPNPFALDGGVLTNASAPSGDILVKELHLCRKLASQLPKPILEVSQLIAHTHRW